MTTPYPLTLAERFKAHAAVASASPTIRLTAQEANLIALCLAQVDNLVTAEEQLLRAAEQVGVLTANLRAERVTQHKIANQALRNTLLLSAGLSMWPLLEMLFP